ncbi:hypothetical protein EOW77_0009675 [Bradyrhizobium yuanmingense]|uniref:nucleotidyl transferase AbiEii/AbiGii toxin family protein n=1 Tax=Bradyrhizobium yuanmingense TaxID=108015 RepID=UPI000FE38C53|nr:hypothetical protein EOW77_0009675 [Bradyrhizobium yuanmingense]
MAGDQDDISPQNVERDYVHGWLLREIFAHRRLSNLLVPRGGSGIRKGYLPGTRYSKDLDFSCESLNENQLHSDLSEILEAAKAGSGVQFAMDRTRVAEKNLKRPWKCGSISKLLCGRERNSAFASRY